jgi:hypothetical protein
VLAQEPHLKLVLTENLANYKIVRGVVSERCCPTHEFTSLANDQAMGIKQARQLKRDFFTSAQRTLDLRGSAITRLTPSSRIFPLWSPRAQPASHSVFVVEQMQLIKSGDRPPANATSCTGREASLCLPHGSVRLILARPLMKAGLCIDLLSGVPVISLPCHCSYPSIEGHRILASSPTL